MSIFDSIGNFVNDNIVTPIRNEAEKVASSISNSSMFNPSKSIVDVETVDVESSSSASTSSEDSGSSFEDFLSSSWDSFKESAASVVSQASSFANTAVDEIKKSAENFEKGVNDSLYYFNREAERVRAEIAESYVNTWNGMIYGEGGLSDTYGSAVDSAGAVADATGRGYDLIFSDPGQAFGSLFNAMGSGYVMWIPFN